MSGRIVNIIIEDSNYHPSCRGGKHYVSVSCRGHYYGRGGPCDNDAKIKRAIEWCKEAIAENNDKAVIVDKRRRKKTARVIKPGKRTTLTLCH